MPAMSPRRVPLIRTRSGVTFQAPARDGGTGFFCAGLTHAFLGGAYAGLGEAAFAIAEGQKGMAIHPSSKDPVEGPDVEETMADIYALLGDADHAIPILDGLLRVPYAMRLLRRCCDSIRSGIKSGTILAFRN